MSRQRDEQKPPRKHMEPVSVDLRLEGHASSASVVVGMEGVTTSTEDNVLVPADHGADASRGAVGLDAALAALNEAQTAG